MLDPSTAAGHLLAPTFNFRVTLRRSRPGGGGQRPDDLPDLLGDGGFQECSGLEIDMDVQELKEGGRNDGIVRMVGAGKYTNLVLKRGMFYAPDGSVDSQFWRWLQFYLSGTRPVPRYDGTIEVLTPSGDPAGRTLATWSFTEGLPARVRGPELNARTGEIAIEELHIAHQGLRLES